jgi:hypothetical protein
MTLPIIQRFETTAARIAYTFTTNDRGFLVEDLELAQLYYIFRSGAGANTCVPFPSEFGEVMFDLRDFHEVSSGGDVGNLADTGGGQLASDSTPTYIGDAAESAVITWAASNSDIIGASTSLPSDFDTTRDCFVDLTTSSGGTTNAATLTVETSWDGGTIVADTATGAASVTPATATATVAAADVPAGANRVTVMLTPASHTTDTMLLFRVRLRYYRK